MPHTPGPWKLSPSGLTVTDGIADPVGGFPNCHPIATTEVYFPLHERQANARLIAAAPDLLALCQEALPELEATAEAYDGPGVGLSTLIARMRAAVLKATK